MNPPKKERLDKLLVKRGLAPTRSKAQALVMAGEVRVNGQMAHKAGMQTSVSAQLELIKKMPFVSRGGYKLEAALDAFPIDAAGKVCADVGACTGGFTDLLLQRGAARVYAIDVGYGQLAWKLRQDKRVIVMERVNARYLEALPEKVDLAIVDVSFISLRLILPAVQGWLTSCGEIVALIKPQFEAGKEQVGKGGVITEAAIHRQVLDNILNWCAANGLTPAAVIRSPITGAAGNIEFLAWLRPHAPHPISLPTLIDSAMA